ncbi:hypothetical protein ElyMa_001787000 [Elysia marginata]|uniref:Uncharacterized protein n=1 Tax=Elysia marginata TaxID=1093978 RepID=A0AAV4EEQ0_9GAST|nr:hypothetical protein ElyMa_001787000 [Elysia marginata]
MPYSLQQYAPPNSQGGNTYTSRVDNDGVNSKIIPPSGNQPTYLPTHHPQHVPLNFVPPHLRPHHHHSQNYHHFPPSPPASLTSSYSNSSSTSSLSSPTSTSSSLSQTMSSLPPPPAGSSSLSRSALPISTTPPSRMVPYGYSSERSKLPPAPRDPEENEVYPLDLSVRSGQRQDCESGGGSVQENPLMFRQRHTSRPPGGDESTHKHHASLVSNSHHNGGTSNASSRAQHRLSPYSIPLGLSGGSAHSPFSMSRSPGPLRTDSPIYGRRRTPSPAYYPNMLPDGAYRAGVTAHVHQQQHYLPSGPPPPHLAPSPSLAVHSEHSSSPSPFQILTTADTVLHGAPIVSGLFKPYQEQVDSEMTNAAGHAGKTERQAEEHSQHQSRDPRRQLLRQLHLSQQQQNQAHQHRSHEQEEEEERTYVDLDCPSQAARSTYSTKPEETSSRRPEEASNDQTDGKETPMEVTDHSSSVLNRQISGGFSEENERRESEQQGDSRPTGPFNHKSELITNSNNIHESHLYLRQALLSSSAQQQREMADVENTQTHFSQHHLQQQEQQHHQQQLSDHLIKQEQTRQEGDNSHRQPRLGTTTSPADVSMAVSSTNETNNCDVGDNKRNKLNGDKVSQEVLEEAKLLAFLSKTTLVTLKPNGQVNNNGSGSDLYGDNTSASRSPDHNRKACSSPINIFKDFQVVSNENDRPGKLPKIDFCLSSSPRTGTPSSCKGSVIAPKKICFRLVDLVGLLVEQSLRA